ncbi:PEP-CTERM sorting domain-containing protein [Massilia sp. UBA6681]|uniref:PEP-CTERM sorting domain-containing protein n=1 Tax=Massilia sp. UBA6681 TaxID=1946839 RepID=UPI0025C07E8C|nr:PEP-CTERM sorting domain-containing protein [Massilia sp. UBA6681]
MEGGDLIQMNGFFSTNANGEVVSAPKWSGMGDMSTSWGTNMGIWFVNGDNFYACTDTDRDCLYVNNVGDTQLGASWSVAFAQDSGSVPEPGSLALLGLGGLALARRYKRK